MRVLYLFFIFLCFLLLGSCNYAYAGANHHNTGYSVVQNIEKRQQIKFANTNQDYLIIKNGSLSDDDDYLIDVEDEDENVVFASKYVILTKCFLALSHTLILNYLYSPFKDRLLVCRRLIYTSSYKYILQRTLRI